MKCGFLVSSYIRFINPTPIPVNYVDFTAENEDKKYYILNWNLWFATRLKLCKSKIPIRGTGAPSFDLKYFVVATDTRFLWFMNDLKKVDLQAECLKQIIWQLPLTPSTLHSYADFCWNIVMLMHDVVYP